MGASIKRKDMVVLYQGILFIQVADIFNKMFRILWFLKCQKGKEGLGP
jgi:hypothetical protein